MSDILAGYESLTLTQTVDPNSSTALAPGDRDVRNSDSRLSSDDRLRDYDADRELNGAVGVSPNKPTPQVGLHRDINTSTDYGGKPDKFPMSNWEGWNDEWSKDYYYAPGEGEYLASLLPKLIIRSEYADYFGNHSDDQISQNPQGYSDSPPDTTFTEGPPGTRGDAYVAPGRKPNGTDAYDTGLPEPTFWLDVGLGPSIYPIQGEQRSRRIENKDGQYSAEFYWDARAKPPTLMVAVADLQDPESAAMRPFLVFNKDSKGNWDPDISASDWKPNGRQNWPQSRLDEAKAWIVGNNVKKIISGTDIAENGNMPQNKASTDPVLLFRGIPQQDWGRSKVLLYQLSKLPEAIRKIIQGEPDGERDGFQWAVRGPVLRLART
jgi:hypothetical protein